MPITDENGTHFPLISEDMANEAERLSGLGVGVFGGCCGTTPEHISAIAKAAKNSEVSIFSKVQELEEGIYVSTSRTFAKIDKNAEYIKINADSEDDIYDLLDESEPEDVLYL